MSILVVAIIFRWVNELQGSPRFKFRADFPSHSSMNAHLLLKDAKADTLKQALGICTDTGKERFDSLFSKNLLTNESALLERQAALFAYKQKSPEVHSLHTSFFQEVQTLEPTLQTVLKPSSLEKESMEQILFSKYPHFQIFNTIPFLLLCVSLWKQYIVPLLAVFMPIFFFIIPFLTMKYYYSLPIDLGQYTKIFCVTLGIPASFEHLQWKQTFQLLFTSISIGQSIYQPIQTSYHIQSIDKDLKEKANALLRLKCIFETMYPDKKELLEDLTGDDSYRSFASGWDFPYRIQLALWMIGDLEVIHRIALHPALQRVKFHRKKFVKMVSLVNPLLETTTPISFSLTPKRSHCLMTGPNGGGKSTVLRCIVLNLVFAQTLGVCFGTDTGTYSLHPFDWIQSGLQLQDLPGQLSMFEREVDFASQALHRARKYPTKRGLLLFDELFHSTNPPDGERTARIFLEQIWKFPCMSSFISTHVFSLAESSPNHIQKLCVPAEKKEDGTLHFTYRLQHGICRVSSVDLVLQKRGFFPPGKPEKVKE